MYGVKLIYMYNLYMQLKDLNVYRVCINIRFYVKYALTPNKLYMQNKNLRLSLHLSMIDENQITVCNCL